MKDSAVGIDCSTSWVIFCLPRELLFCLLSSDTWAVPQSLVLSSLLCCLCICYAMENLTTPINSKRIYMKLLSLKYISFQTANIYSQLPTGYCLIINPKINVSKSKIIWVQVLIPSSTDCVTLGKLSNLWKLQFLHLLNTDNSIFLY